MTTCSISVYQYMQTAEINTLEQICFSFSPPSRICKGTKWATEGRETTRDWRDTKRPSKNRREEEVKGEVEIAIPSPQWRERADIKFRGMPCPQTQGFGRLGKQSKPISSISNKFPYMDFGFLILDFSFISFPFSDGSFSELSAFGISEYGIVNPIQKKIPFQRSPL